MTTTATGTCSTAPADARHTAAVTRAALCSGTTIPVAPAPSALRAIAPEVLGIGDLVEAGEKRPLDVDELVRVRVAIGLAERDDALVVTCSGRGGQAPNRAEPGPAARIRRAARPRRAARARWRAARAPAVARREELPGRGDARRRARGSASRPRNEPEAVGHVLHLPAGLLDLLAQAVGLVPVAAVAGGAARFCELANVVGSRVGSLDAQPEDPEASVEELRLAGRAPVVEDRQRLRRREVVLERGGEIVPAELRRRARPRFGPRFGSRRPARLRRP